EDRSLRFVVHGFAFGFGGMTSRHGRAIPASGGAAEGGGDEGGGAVVVRQVIGTIVAASSGEGTSRHGCGAFSFPHAIEIPASAAATNFARRARIVFFASSAGMSPRHHPPSFLPGSLP